MRPITPRLTPELQAHCGSKSVWRAEAYHVQKFRALVQHVAKLAYINSDELLFFRGQSKDYQSKAGGTTLYPSIYRGDAVQSRELRYRFRLLDQAASRLVELWGRSQIDGYTDLRKKRYIQWSILQHYGVADTPLLDFTHSLRVACSFAQLNGSGSACYVYVLGLPYVTNRITINSEHDIANIRLLSICPPDALRPHFQEGYLAATTDVTTDFDSKTELDFRNRLIAKFRIPRNPNNFWRPGFDPIPETALFPKSDMILDLCEQLKSELEYQSHPGDLGEFVKQWAILEEYLLRIGRRVTERNLSVREAISALQKNGVLSKNVAEQIQGIRAFRNNVVHKPSSIQSSTLETWLEKIQQILPQVPINGE